VFNPRRITLVRGDRHYVLLTYASLGTGSKIREGDFVSKVL
jgi:hypothetical protein